MIKTLKKRWVAKSSRGDTLIEVVFALVIIGVIIAVAIQGAISANRSSVDARMRTQAQFYTNYQIEGIRAYRNSVYWSSAEGTPNLLTQLENVPFNMSITTGSSCLGTESDSFFIDPNAGNFELHYGIGEVAPYKFENKAKLTQCNNTDASGNNYGADSVTVTTKVTWTSASGKSEKIEVTNYLTNALIDH